MPMAGGLAWQAWHGELREHGSWRPGILSHRIEVRKSTSGAATCSVTERWRCGRLSRRASMMPILSSWARQTYATTLRRNVKHSKCMVCDARCVSARRAAPCRLIDMGAGPSLEITGGMARQQSRDHGPFAVRQNSRRLGTQEIRKCPDSPSLAYTSQKFPSFMERENSACSGPAGHCYWIVSNSRCSRAHTGEKMPRRRRLHRIISRARAYCSEKGATVKPLDGNGDRAGPPDVDITEVGIVWHIRFLPDIWPTPLFRLPPIS
jgi:hypothetical protein